MRAALRCPGCRGELEDVPAADGRDAALSCTGSCRCSYPVVDGIPVLLVDEARPPAGGNRP